jgi:hypothetical protein
MALKAKGLAKYVRGISRVRFIPHNGNGTFPGATSGVFGGAGPFDFSAAHAVISAVPIKLKLDNGAELADTLDLSTYVETAVTAANFVSAFTASAVGGGWSASVDSDTGRIKIVNSAGVYAQVYGQAAELAGFGRGAGAQFVKCDTLESINVAPDVKAEEKDTVTGADGEDTTVISEGYVKGATGSLVDTAQDYNLMRLMSGGSIDSDGAFSMPNASSKKPYFGVEIFNPIYGKGESKQGEMTGYEKVTVYNAMGTVGDDAWSKSFRKKNYSFTAATYKNAAGVEQTAVKYEELTLAEYAALDIDNV